MQNKKGHLVITRRPGETLFVGDAEIKVERIGKGRVSLGIVAPPEVKVVRGELVESATVKDSLTVPAERPAEVPAA